MTRWSYGAVFLVVQPLITVVCFCLVGKFLCDMEILEYHGLPPYHPVTLRGQLGDFGVLVEDVFWGHPLRVGIFALAASVVAEAALLSLRKLKILGHGYGSYLGIVIGYVWLPIFGTWLFLKWILVDPTLGIDIDGNDFVLLLSLSAGQLVPSLWTSHALCSMVAMTNGNPRQPTGSHLNI
jgi:hypothetical protein